MSIHYHRAYPILVIYGYNYLLIFFYAWFIPQYGLGLT